MDIKDIRRENLRTLMNREFSGVRGAQSRLAERLGKSQNYVSRCLFSPDKAGAKNIGEDFAREIEQAFGLAQHELDDPELARRVMGAAPAVQNKADELELIGNLSPWHSETPLDEDEVFVPLYKEVELAAGHGSTAVQEITDRKIRFALSTLREAGVMPQNAVAAQAKGNSMERLIMDGATIGIDRGTTQIIDGEIYAIDHDGMLRVKYLYRMPGGGVRLRSENDEEHPDEVIAAEDMHHLQILGWVFWWSTVRRRRGAPIGK